MIEITQTSQADPMTFQVVVTDAQGASTHHVTISQADWRRLTGGKGTPQDCIEAAFRFLLAREPRKQILSRFDVSVIARYFPEFEQRLPDYF